MKYLKIKKAELVPDNFGKHIEIRMIGLYDKNGKWIKWVKLDEKIVNKLLSEMLIVKSEDYL